MWELRVLLLLARAELWTQEQSTTPSTDSGWSHIVHVLRKKPQKASLSCLLWLNPWKQGQHRAGTLEERDSVTPTSPGTLTARGGTVRAVRSWCWKSQSQQQELLGFYCFKQKAPPSSSISKNTRKRQTASAAHHIWKSFLFHRGGEK